MSEIRAERQESWEGVERCPLCGQGSRGHAPFRSVADHGLQLRYLRCRRCGLVFQSPRMSESSLKAFYAAQYRQLVQGQEGVTEKDYRMQHGRARHLVDFVAQRRGSLGRCLDVGSSTGALLIALQRQFGCQAYGVEPGAAYRRFSQGRGLAVVEGLEDLDPSLQRSFDLISIIHVLEHMPDPVSALSDLRSRWLSPQGALLIEVPNLYGHMSFELAHLIAFSAHTLRETLRRAGFALEGIVAHGRPRSRLIPLYLTAWAVPAQGDAAAPRPERLVGLRRWAGDLWRAAATRLFPWWAWLPLPDVEGQDLRGEVD